MSSLYSKNNRPRVSADFVDLVRSMRLAQRKYFADRSRLLLKAAIDAEKLVDDYLIKFEVLEMRLGDFGPSRAMTETQLIYNFENEEKTKEGPEK